MSRRFVNSYLSTADGNMREHVVPVPQPDTKRTGRATVTIRLRVGTSRIHGQGVFAAQDITKGTRILPYLDLR